MKLDGLEKLTLEYVRDASKGGEFASLRFVPAGILRAANRLADKGLLEREGRCSFKVTEEGREIA